uniref:Major facilitator superfamily (MFS) profile domain-containing protein n=2 Tax=Photinus pyralis TaxID=7054 RepID=A0A1Y1JW82_PHOPY
MAITEASIYDHDMTYPIHEKNCLVYKLSGHVPARLVLYLLSWSGFLVSFMMRTDINIAIVAMVKDANPQANGGGENTTAQYCFTTTNETVEVTNYGGTLEWSPAIQNYVLTTFYWAYIVSQLVGGWATQRIGTKKVFGYSQLVTALCSLCIPWASEVHYGIVIALRSAQGFASGLTWPAMYALVGHWIPVPERSRFMSSFQGFAIGIGITYPLCGFLIAQFGWQSAFYMTGSSGVIWCLIWYLLAFDNPETHPRISLSEQKYIKENTINSYATSRNRSVPWRAMFKSMPAWSIGITTFGRIWVHYVFIISGPKYMKNILGFSIEKNGFLSGAPFVCSYIASVFFCYVADKLVINQIMSLTNVRKLFTALAQVVPGLLCVVIGYLGCDIVGILICWFIAVTLITAAYAGAMANIVDIAPNFAGPVLAFAQTIHMSASFLSPLASGYIIQDGYTLSDWQTVFNIAAGVACATYIVYQIWGTEEVQPWNDVDSQEHVRENERMINEKSQTTIILQGNEAT